MKPIQRTDVKTFVDIDESDEQIQMGIDANSIAFLLSTLSNLYSDTETAVLRELATNAWDAHVEIGETRPIEITTPNGLSQFLRIRDYGVGMSLDTLRRVYSMYGASTKRDSDLFNGMLGLGSKAPIAYTNQFTVVSVKDGERITVAVTKNDQGVPVMTIMERSATTEHSGVTITIPAKRVNDFQRKAKELFKFWPKGRMLLNGVDPAGIQDERKITDRLSLVPSLDQDYVVMGNVAYRISDNYRLGQGYRGFGRGNGYGVIARVDIGAVQFTPSREDLNYTNHTKAALAALKTEFQQSLGKFVSKDIANAATHAEAAKRYFEWVDSVGPMAAPVYKGIAIPDSVGPKSPANPKDPQDLIHSYNPFGYRDKISQANRYGRNELTLKSIIAGYQYSEAVFVSGWNGEDITPTRKKKILQWAEGRTWNGKSLGQFYFTKQRFGSPWLDDCLHVDFATLEAVQLPKTARVKAQKAKYDVLQPNGTLKDTDEVERKDSAGNTLPILFYTPAEFDRWNQQHLTPLLDRATLVSIGKNRWDKFKRDWPQAIHIREWMTNEADSLVKILTEDDIIGYNMGKSERYGSTKGWVAFFRRLSSQSILDPEVGNWIRVSQIDTKSPSLEKYQTMTRLAGKMGIHVPDIPERFFMQDYPLISNGYLATMDYKHAATYINAVYTTQTIH